MTEIIARLEALQAQDPENALLRFSLGNAYLGAARQAEAAAQFAEAVRRVEDRLAPALPHQTVHAIFPHTAFRCSSHQGMRIAPPHVY